MRQGWDLFVSHSPSLVEYFISLNQSTKCTNSYGSDKAFSGGGVGGSRRRAMVLCEKMKR